LIYKALFFYSKFVPEIVPDQFSASLYSSLFPQTPSYFFYGLGEKIEIQHLIGKTGQSDHPIPE